MAELFRYAAFVSYSSKDARFAQRLHRALESYGIPASLGKFDLIGGGKANRIYPVFRDREELSAGQLGEQIEAHLRAAAALIVICSPNSAASPWVQKEIEFFAGLGRRDKIFAIIPDNAPLIDDSGADCTPTCFPPAFRGDALQGDALEPLAADARKGKDGFRNAWLKIVAGMIGVTPGQIIDRDRRRRRQRATATALSAAALAVVLGFVGAVFEGLSWRRTLAAEISGLWLEGQTVETIPLALAYINDVGNMLPTSPDEAALRRPLSLGSAFIDESPIPWLDPPNPLSSCVIQGVVDGLPSVKEQHPTCRLVPGSYQLGPLLDILSVSAAGNLVLTVGAPPRRVELPPGASLRINSQRTHVVVWSSYREDSQDYTNAFYLDLASGEQRSLGLEWRGTHGPIFSLDGRRIVYPTGQWDVAEVLDLATDQFSNLPRDTFFDTSVSNSDGDVSIVTQAGEILIGPEQGRSTSYGDEMRIAFNADGRLARVEGVYSFVVDLTRTETPGLSASERARHMCATDGGSAALPLPLWMRGRGIEGRWGDEWREEAVRRRSAILPILVGRPWHPCDWRGIASVFPNPTRGDGWFEGPRQWWRMISIRWFGGADYRCGEVNAAGTIRSDRVESCRERVFPEFLPEETAAPS